MLYRPDIEKVKEKYEAFWDRDLLERPLLMVTSPKDGIEPYKERSVDPVTKWTDIDYIIEDRERKIKSTYFAAEAVPHATIGIQGGAIAAFLGCELEFRPETYWFKPVIDDWESYKLDFDPQESKWWEFTKELSSRMVEAGKDKYLVDLPDFQSDMDTLCDMRGAEKLCLDLYSHREKIKEALNYIFDVYKFTFTEIHRILTKYTNITSHWMGLISDKKHDVLQADFLAIISPKMAEEFVIPNIRKEADFLERSIFHLDGPDAVDKLDLLLDIDKLNAIQWVPGAGSPTAVHWLPMLKRIQDKKKVLWISSPAEEVKELVNDLELKGLIIAVVGSFKNEQEADEFVNQVEKWCKEKS